MSKKSRAQRLVGEYIDYEFAPGLRRFRCRVMKMVMVPKKTAWKVENHRRLDKPVLALELRACEKHPYGGQQTFRVKYSDRIYRRWKKYPESGEPALGNGS